MHGQVCMLQPLWDSTMCIEAQRHIVTNDLQVGTYSWFQCLAMALMLI